MILDSVVVNPTTDKYNFSRTDTALMAALTIYSQEGTSYQARPVLQVKGYTTNFIVDTVHSQNLAIAFVGIEDEKKIKIQTEESDALMEFITLKAYMFPFINILWAGVVIMVVGMIISMVRRISLNRKTPLGA